MKNETKSKAVVVKSRQKIVVEKLEKVLGGERLDAMLDIWGKMQFAVILGEMLNDKVLAQFQDDDYLVAQIALKIGRRACFPTRKEDVDRLSESRAAISK
jgi:NADPH:quinone reductase-like Zn-dependent oxidoreductase